MIGITAPTSWEYVSLSELLLGIEAGKSFKCEERPPGNDEIGVAKVSAVTWGEYDELESKTCTDPSRINSALFVEAGDFLFSRANTIDLVGACVIAARVTRRVMLSDKILRLEFVDDRHKPWVLHFLRSHEGREQIKRLSSGNQESMRNIGQERIGQIRIPLPPDRERELIVEKLEELLADLAVGVDDLKAAGRKLAQYRQSLLKAAVEGALTADWRAAQGAPQESGEKLLQRILVERRARWEQKQLAKFAEQGKTPPKGWQAKYPEALGPALSGLPTLPVAWTWASLDQLSASVRNGLSQKPSQERVGYPILRINAVRPMSVNLDETRYLSISADEAAPYVLTNGDLLATRYNGSVDLLGVFGVVRGLSRDTVHPDKLIRIEPILREHLADWIEIAAAIGASRAHITSRVKTTAGQTGISGEDLKRMPIPLPPISEKAQISSLIHAAVESCSSQQRSTDRLLVQAAAQRKNLLKAAFSGQLVEQDPNDEPATELLARIRTERGSSGDSTSRHRRKAK